jgi:RNA polymerase sigma-70 factor (ECF subfamily)
MRSNHEVCQAIEKYGDSIRRLCMIHLKNYDDTEDIFQNVFLKYAIRDDLFISEKHEKAWLFQVTLNECRDLLRRFFHSRTVSLNELMDIPQDMKESHREVLEALLALPEKYRISLYLYYYEGYTAREIGDILKKNVNTVYSLINRGKTIMKEALTDE